MKRLFIQLLLRTYSQSRRSGVLDHRLFRSCFTKAYFAYKRYFEDPFHGLAKARPALFENGHILDVGGGLGFTSAVFSTVVSPGFRVHVFEPESFNYSIIEEGVGQRSGGIVVLNHAAVGDHAGVARLDINEAHIADHRVGVDGTSNWAGRTGTRSEVVPLLTLDDYFENTLAREPVSFIKIDVQGHELKVLKGARKLLTANPAAAIALEYDPVRLREVGDSPEALLAYLSTQGLKLYECSGELRPITSPMQLDQLTASKDYCDLLCSRRPL